MAEIRVGVSGWRYTPWRGVFYPPELPQRLELWYASRRMSAVEINGTFYSLQRPEYFAEWYEDTPEGFIFAVKGPRFVTHMKRLRNIETPLANFFASGVFNLREKLGPVLWQFPPNFAFDPARFEAFFALLPGDTAAALRLARRRDFRLRGRARLAIDACRPLRHAIEVRHESFVSEEFVALLRKYGIALVVAETAGKWPLVEEVTTDFMYVRLHGDAQLYRSGYEEAALRRWASRVKSWHRGGEPSDAKKISRGPAPARRARDVYCFFDNTDEKLRAPVDAQVLMRNLHLTVAQPPELPLPVGRRTGRAPKKPPRSPRTALQADAAR
jgi:uncharacterized protein YecE (DUF72 family)